MTACNLDLYHVTRCPTDPAHASSATTITCGVLWSHPCRTPRPLLPRTLGGADAQLTPWCVLTGDCVFGIADRHALCRMLQALEHIVMTLTGKVLLQSRKLHSKLMITIHQDRFYNSIMGMAKAHDHGAVGAHAGGICFDMTTLPGPGTPITCYIRAFGANAVDVR